MAYKVVFSQFDKQYKVVNNETGVAQSSWNTYKEANVQAQFLNRYINRSAKQMTGAAA